MERNDPHASMIWVTLNLGRSAANRRWIINIIIIILIIKELIKVTLSQLCRLRREELSGNFTVAEVDIGYTLPIAYAALGCSALRGKS